MTAERECSEASTFRYEGLFFPAADGIRQSAQLDKQSFPLIRD